MYASSAPIRRVEELAHRLEGFPVEGIADKFVAEELEDVLLRRADAAVVRRDLPANDLDLAPAFSTRNVIPCTPSNLLPRLSPAATAAAITSPTYRQCFFTSSAEFVFLRFA